MSAKFPAACGRPGPCHDFGLPVAGASDQDFLAGGAGPGAREKIARGRSPHAIVKNRARGPNGGPLDRQNAGREPAAAPGDERRARSAAFGAGAGPGGGAGGRSRRADRAGKRGGPPKADPRATHLASAKFSARRRRTSHSPVELTVRAKNGYYGVKLPQRHGERRLPLPGGPARCPVPALGAAVRARVRCGGAGRFAVRSLHGRRPGLWRLGFGKAPPCARNFSTYADHGDRAPRGGGFCGGPSRRRPWGPGAHGPA